MRAARASSDTIVVYLHWGNERLECPTGVQKVLARELRDAGADIIVGAHAHRVQGDGYLDGAFVAYGLGNFVWPRGDVGAVIEVKATGRVIEGYRWIPMSVNASVPSPMDEAARRGTGRGVGAAAELHRPLGVAQSRVDARLRRWRQITVASRSSNAPKMSTISSISHSGDEKWNIAQSMRTSSVF